VVVENESRIKNSKTNPSKKQVRIMLGATYLFEEPGTLAKVATLAAEWFRQKLAEEIKQVSWPTAAASAPGGEQFSLIIG